MIWNNEVRTFGGAWIQHRAELDKRLASALIRHIFMWQAADPRDKQPIIDLLSRLSGRLLMIRSWEIGGHVGEPNDNGDPWDGALITDFDSFTDLEAYSNDPFHNEIVQELLPLVRSRAVVDFVREEA
jgi:hypothetical protein